MTAPKEVVRLLQYTKATGELVRRVRYASTEPVGGTPAPQPTPPDQDRTPGTWTLNEQPASGTTRDKGGNGPHDVMTA